MPRDAPRKYNLDNFNAYAGNDTQILQEFIQSFIDANREHSNLLYHYFENEDYPNVGDTAHKMKNTFGELHNKPMTCWCIC
ncbi:MAG: hypothetical protein U5L96_21495 [Owenweeksia sp.]|nr:hypothetical protein [Owenweeksia sp.]